MLEEIAVRLGNADRLQRHAVLAQRGFHILERFAHATVFWQQVITQRAGDGAGDTAIQRGFNQTIKLAAIAGRAQTTRHHAKIKQHGVIIGD